MREPSERGPSVAVNRSRESGLRAGAVGLPAVVFQSVANMAPGAAIAFSILFATQYAGGSSPLAVLIGLGLALLVAVTIGQLAKHLPSAGGLYTYNARGLGSNVGFMVGWMYILAEVAVAPGSLLILGIVISSAVTTNLGGPSWIWMPTVAAGWLVIWWLVYRGVRLSTSASVMLGIFEVAVFLALAISLIVGAGKANTWTVFTPGFHSKHGSGSIALGIVYAVFGIIGFEAAAPLGEEAADPRRTIPRAVVVSCLSIGLLYVLAYYGATVFFGPGRTLGLVNYGGGSPWNALARDAWGLGFIVVILALVNSSIAGGNSSSVATTRVGYALGRIRMLPSFFTRVRPDTGSPTVAVHVQAIFALGYALVIGWATGGPLNALMLQGTISTIAIIAIYIATSVSCIVYYLRERRREFNILLHGVIPAVAALAFVPVLLAAFGVDYGIGISALTYPANYAAYVVYGWFAAGLIILGYFLARHRERIAQTALVFTEEPGTGPPVPPDRTDRPS